MKTEVVDLSVDGNLSSGPPAMVAKFVLVEHDDLISLVFGPVDRYRYHAALLDRFCQDRDIPTAWVKKPDLVEVFDDSLEIRGGGWIEVDPDKRRVKLYGYSTAYGRFHSDQALKTVASHPAFAEFTIKVRQ